MRPFPVRSLLVFLAILVAAFLLRAASGIRSTEPFGFDTALHLRMTERALAGELGERDPLRLVPDGVHITETQPTGLYSLAADWHRTIGRLIGELAPSLRSFNTSFGALIVVPVFWLAWITWRSVPAALLSAAAIAIIPAHVLRTHATVFRFDAVGSLLIGLQLAAIGVALRGYPNRRANVLAATAVAVSTVFLGWVWRAAVGVVASEAIALLMCALMMPAHSLARAAAGLLAGILALGAVSYYSQVGWLWSNAGVSIIVMLGGLLALARSAHHSRLGNMIAIVGTIAIAGGMRAWLPAQPIDDQDVGAAIALADYFGLGTENSFLTTLYRSVQELQPSGWHALVGTRVFSGVLLLSIVGGVVLFRRRRSQPEGPLGPFLLILAGMWWVATIGFERQKVLAAIPIAVLAGGTWVAATSLSSRARVGFAQAAIGVALITSGAGALKVVRESAVRVTGPVRAITADLTAGRAQAILCDWGLAYTYQTNGGVGTFTDGYLELPENRRRMKQVSRALIASDPSLLASICQEYGLDHIVLDERERAWSFVYAGVVPAPDLTAGDLVLPPSAMKSMAWAVHDLSSALPGFKRLPTRGTYSVLEFQPESGAPLPRNLVEGKLICAACGVLSTFTGGGLSPMFTCTSADDIRTAACNRLRVPAIEFDEEIAGRIRALALPETAVSAPLRAAGSTALGSWIDTMWDELSPFERIRLGQILIRRVSVDPSSGRYELTFSPAGVTVLVEELGLNG